MGNNAEQDLEIKYQAFVSSPFSLGSIRQLIVNAVLIAGHIPLRMESEPAKSENTLQVIKNAINKSDIYILILGHEYGSRLIDDDGAESISYTEWEYNQALESEAEILIYLMSKDEIHKKRKLLDPDKEREAKELRNTDMFWGFYDKVSNNKNHFISIWSDDGANTLAMNITAALKDTTAELKVKKPGRGLISAASADDLEVAERLIRNELRKDVHKRFNNFVELDARCAEEKEQKKTLAKVFAKFYTNFLPEKNLNLYFDTGSTPAYVAKEMETALNMSGRARTQQSYICSANVATNSALTFLHLWLSSNIPCSIFPVGPVENPYGASHGPISLFGQEDSDQPPDYGRVALDKEENRRITELCNISKTLGFSNSNKAETIIVGGTSGMKLDDAGPNDEIPDELSGLSTDNRVTEAIKKYRGFHVGDYHSMLFKRYLFTTNFPIVVCMHYNKFKHPIAKGRCHLVFDQEYSWEEFVIKYPFAICVGYGHKDEGELLEMVQDIGLHLLVEPKLDDMQHKGIIAGNDVFIKRLGL